MANGETKRIAEIQTGDLVLATNPQTGDTSPQPVTAVLPHTDIVHTLHTSDGPITVTKHHTFWNATLNQWQQAQHLTPGHQLHPHTTIIGYDTTTPTYTYTYDLTIAHHHTYYIHTNTTTLTHNCNTPRPTSGRPDFIVRPNGEIVPVPTGAVGPSPVRSGSGFQFRGGSGGHGLDPRVTDVRIMDPVVGGKHPLPNGYVSYGNASGQTVNPWTGRTIGPADPWWHWEWSPR